MVAHTKMHEFTPYSACSSSVEFDSMNSFSVVAEGFAIACGLFMAAVSVLLWQHHPQRPAWGLRWFSAAMGLGALTNLLAPVLITGVGRMGFAGTVSSVSGFFALVVGVGSLAALVVGLQHYVLKPPRDPWRMFLGVWLGSQIAVLLSDRLLSWSFSGDLIVSAVFLYGARLSFAAAHREPGVGHRLLTMTFLAQPIALALLAVWGLEVHVARYLAEGPYACVGLVLLSVSLVRIRSELAAELVARGKAEQELRRSQQALELSHAVHLALVRQAPVPMSYSPVVDGRVTETFWNRAWYTTFGYPQGSKERVSGSAFDLWTDLLARDRFAEHLFERHQVGPYEAVLKNAAGSHRLCEMYGSLIDSGDGRFVMTTYIDITEQRVAEEELRASRDQFQSLIDNLLGTAYRCKHDAEWTMLYLSPGILDISGYRPDELLGNAESSFAKLVHPDDLRIVGQVDEAVRSRRSWDLEYRILHRDGEYRWVAEKGSAIRGEDGEVLYLDGFIIEVTARKLAQQELDKARRMTEVIARAQRDFILHKDRRKSFDGLLSDILSLTESDQGFIGEVLRSSDQRPYLKTIAKTHRLWDDSAMHRANAPNVMEVNLSRKLFDQVLANGQPVLDHNTEQSSRPDGLPEGQPAISASLGVPVHVGDELVAMFAVTKQLGSYDTKMLEYLQPLSLTIGQLVWAMHSEVKQRETELRLDSVSNNLPNSMLFQISCGKDGHARHFTYLSEGVHHLHGLSRDAVLQDARVLYSRINPDDYAKFVSLEIECLRTMSDLNAEYRSVGPNGDERWFYVSSTPSRNASGSLVLDGIQIDITERKEAERKLEELNLTLEERVSERTRELTKAVEDLNRTQQDLIQSEKLAALGSLVAGVAHEMNTPIGNAVTVSSSLLEAHTVFCNKIEAGITRSALKDFLANVGEAGQILSRNLERAADLVSSFKQVAVDQGNHQRRTFSLYEILSEVHLIMAPGLRKAQVSLRIDMSGDLTLDSYPGALTQVLMILINNTLAHAFEDRSSGTVTIGAKVKSADRVHISVTDDGVGIPPANLGRVFEPFYTTKLGKGGSGLGLHICYNVVTGTLGGKVNADSVVGQGTAITIEIPLSAPRVGDTAPRKARNGQREAVPDQG